MKIVDENGRLFGKINVIDFLVILFLVSLLPIFHFGHKILTKKPPVTVEEVMPPGPGLEPEPEKKFIEIEFDCQFQKLKPDTLILISVGDKELDENGQAIGEIVNLDQGEPHKYEFNIGTGKKMVKEDLLLKQVSARLRLRAEFREDNLYYKDRPIRSNSTIDFKTDRYQVEAVIFFKEKEREKTTSQENRIATQENRIATQENRIAAQENRIATQENKIATQENRIAAQENRIATQENKIATQENKINILEKKVESILSSRRIRKLMERR